MATESRKRTVEDTDSGSAKKAKKKSSSHYDCEVTCLDGSKLNLTVNVCFKKNINLCFSFLPFHYFIISFLLLYIHIPCIIFTLCFSEIWEGGSPFYEDH